MVTHAWLEEWLPLLSKAALKVYLILMKHSNCFGDEAYPGYNSMQTKTGLSRTAIAKGIRELESYGIVSVKRKFKSSSHYSFPSSPKSRPDSSSKKLPTGSKSKPDENKQTKSGSENGLESGSKKLPHLVAKMDSNKRKEQEPLNKSIQTTKKPSAPKKSTEQKIKDMNDPDLAAYKRNAGGVHGIWLDSYDITAKIKTRPLSADEHGQLNNIWKDAMASAEQKPDQAIQLVRVAIRQAWIDHKDPEIWRFKDPPTPAGVHKHWNSLISAKPKEKKEPAPKEYDQMLAELAEKQKEKDKMYGPRKPI
jgi:biotin operon repressor